jgi:hypothetical protein
MPEPYLLKLMVEHYLLKHMLEHHMLNSAQNGKYAKRPPFKPGYNPSPTSKYPGLTEGRWHIPGLEWSLQADLCVCASRPIDCSATELLYRSRRTPTHHVRLKKAAMLPTNNRIHRCSPRIMLFESNPCMMYNKQYSA